MKKKWRSAGVTAVLCFLLASSVSVWAEDRQGASGWQVTFDGKKMESNFTSADMSNEAGAMQPGDSVELTVTIKNTFDGQADWYMKNEVLESLEDAGDAAGGAYDYLLTYTDIKGQTTTLYSSEKFGGDGKIGGVGLHGATNSLQNYFYLDRMGNGESGVVTELVSGQTAGGDESTTPGDPSGLRTDRNAVKTGDETKIMRYVVLMFGSGLILLAGGIFLLRRQQEEET